MHISIGKACKLEQVIDSAWTLEDELVFNITVSLPFTDYTMMSPIREEFLHFCEVLMKLFFKKKKTSCHVRVDW